MIAWVLFVVIFLAPTPAHPSVEVKVSSIPVASQDVLLFSLAAGAVAVQAHQDPKILDFAVHCIAVTGDIGKHA